MGIIGIGVDSIEIERVKKATESETFLRRVFTEEETKYAKKGGSLSAESMAGAFAAKEAAVKALGVGFSKFGPESVEVCHDELGAPKLHFLGKAAEYAEEIGVKKSMLSISHDRTKAIAFVVLEG